jgi:hypothetical protein
VNVRFDVKRATTHILLVSGEAPGPRPAEAPSFINIRLADELAASGRTSEHAQGAARAGSSFAKLS